MFLADLLGVCSICSPIYPSSAGGWQRPSNIALPDNKSFVSRGTSSLLTSAFVSRGGVEGGQQGDRLEQLFIDCWASGREMGMSGPPSGHKDSTNNNAVLLPSPYVEEKPAGSPTKHLMFKRFISCKPPFSDSRFRRLVVYLFSVIISGSMGQIISSIKVEPTFFGYLRSANYQPGRYIYEAEFPTFYLSFK